MLSISSNHGRLGKGSAPEAETIQFEKGKALKNKKHTTCGEYLCVAIDMLDGQC